MLAVPGTFSPHLFSLTFSPLTAEKVPDTFSRPDRAYGNVKRIQRELYGNRVIASDLTNPDFPKLASSFSLFSQRATTPDELRAALDRALTRNEPALIEVPLGELPRPGPTIMPRVRG